MHYFMGRSSSSVPSVMRLSSRRGRAEGGAGNHWSHIRPQSLPNRRIGTPDDHYDALLFQAVQQMKPGEESLWR